MFTPCAPRVSAAASSIRYVGLTDRRRGYQAALLRAGIMPSTELMLPQEPGSEVKGYQQMRKLVALPGPPTAVYAVSDNA